MKKVKYIVLGAGVSGLSFARSIDDEVIVIEKNHDPGGYCRTIRQSGFVWDYAGHFFHFSNPRIKEQFMDVIESNDVVIRKKNTKIYYNGSYVDYPFQTHIHQLQKTEMIDCLYDLFNKQESGKYNSFLDMLYGKFGQAITEKFLRPYNEKLYACDLNMLDENAMGRFFPYANKNEIIRNMKEENDSSYNDVFLYPKNGSMVFVEKLLESIKEGTIKYDEEVAEIDLTNKTVETSKETYSYDYLISTIPLNQFAQLLKSELLDEDRLSYNQVLVLNLGFDNDSLDSEIHWIYVPSKAINFYRAGFYNNIIGTDRLSMYIEIGYPKDAIITEDVIEQQLGCTMENLRKMGIIDSHELIDYSAIVMSPAYVHITNETNEAIKALKKELQEHGVYLAGRYSNWKYCSIEDCMLDAIDIVNSIKNDIKSKR